jgi:hypothetical protein
MTASEYWECSPKWSKILLPAMTSIADAWAATVSSSTYTEIKESSLFRASNDAHQRRIDGSSERPACEA